MPDDIQECYRHVLSQAAIPFEPVTTVEDWHLRIFFLPGCLPETVYDVDHRGKQTLFYCTRLQSSAWLAVMQARQKKGQIQPVTSERACAELPESHALVRLVADEHVFRMGDTQCHQVDGDSYVVELTHSSGVVEFEAWSSTMDDRWHRILNALQSASALLPENQ